MPQKRNTFPLIFFAFCGIALLLTIVLAHKFQRINQPNVNQLSQLNPSKPSEPSAATPRFQQTTLVHEDGDTMYTYTHTLPSTDTGYARIQFSKLPISIEVPTIPNSNPFTERYFDVDPTINEDKLKFSGYNILASQEGVSALVLAAYADNYRNNIEAGQFEFNDYIKNPDGTLTLISPDDNRFTLKKEYFSFMKTKDGYEVLKVYGPKDLADIDVTSPIGDGLLAAIIKVHFGEFKSVSIFSYMDEADFDRAIQSIEIRE